MLSDTLKFSSVQINVPKNITKKIMDWSTQEIEDDDLYEEPGYGREEESHVTVLYGLHTDSPAIAKEIAKRTEPFTLELRKVSLFIDNPLFEVMKISIRCSEIHELNSLFRKKTEYTNKHDDYKPHITIAYIKKRKGWRYDGVDVFEGLMFQADTLIFSDRHRNQTKCPLA